jgi:3'(2'), 5'-bisphosphate nucleotidase
MKNLMEIAVKAAYEAGQKILEVYSRDFSVETKDDKSPLTEADKASHNEIKMHLTPTMIPILSEEGKQMTFDERKNWQQFWLVDPLDGTKEFIKKNGEFTVNIALVKNGIPVGGVVYVPVKKEMYFGYEGAGSFIFTVSEDSDIISQMHHSAMLPSTNTNVYSIVASRSHNSPETELFIEEKKKHFGEVSIVSSGSSIKLCLVAEGKANVYPRLAPTMEWDTAAGHAVAKYAGCRVYQYETGHELEYNKENLLNPWFVVERN